MKKILPLIFVLSLFGCCEIPEEFPCESEMNDIRSKYGPPEEARILDSGESHAHVWWYWTRGMTFTFTWDEDHECKWTTATFTPIKKISEAAKEKVRQEIISNINVTSNRDIKK